VAEVDRAVVRQPRRRRMLHHSGAVSGSRAQAVKRAARRAADTGRPRRRAPTGPREWGHIDGGGSGTGYGTLIASFAVAMLPVGLTLRAVSGPVQLGIVGGLAVVAVFGSEARSRLFSRA
jgi:hypothetical protein